MRMANLVAHWYIADLLLLSAARRLRQGSGTVSRMLQEGVLLPSLWALFLPCARHLVAVTHVVHKPYNSLIIVWRLYEEPYYTRVLRLRQGPRAGPDPGLRGPGHHERREPHGPGPRGAVNEFLVFPTVNQFRVARLRGRAWRLTAQNGGFWPGQQIENFCNRLHLCVPAAAG
jgi:hypothetical protein